MAQSAAKGGDHDSGGGSSTAAETADAPFLSYKDPDSGDPLPGFGAPKFDPSSSVGLHLESPHLRNKMVKSKLCCLESIEKGNVFLLGG